MGLPPLCALEIRGPLVGVALAASTHALPDAAKPLSALWPYLLLLTPPLALTTPAFAAASVCHFATDGVGWRASLCGHAAVAALASAGHVEIASALGCAYYLGVHVRIAWARAWQRDPRCAALSAAAAAALLPFTATTTTFRLTERVQKLVVGHAIVSGQPQAHAESRLVRRGKRLTASP